MLNDPAYSLRRRLRRVGLSESAIDAAWPIWWSDEADSSSSARAELRYSLARKLGLDPRSLLEDDSEPIFVWRDVARFKHLGRETDQDKAVISSFGAALGGLLISATKSEFSIAGRSATDLRQTILQRKPFVGLSDLLSLCWTAGIPAIHLRIFPWRGKRMSAMTVRVNDRNAILLARDSQYPAQIAFYLAHELGHILLDHLGSEGVLVDFEAPSSHGSGLQTDNVDPPGLPDFEEFTADSFALELLTGESDPKVLPMAHVGNARSLADAVLRSAEGLRIEPGTLALCYGYSTGAWNVAIASLRYIYRSARPVWELINTVALGQLSLEEVHDDLRIYLLSVLGGNS
jgi:hypothetical protein